MIDSERIKMLTAALIKAGKIKNENDLCVQLGFPSSNFANIKSGERKIPASLKLKLINQMDINPDFLSGDSEVIVKRVESSTNTSEVGQVWREAIALVNRAMSLIEQDHEAIHKNNDVLRAIVVKGLDADAIRFDTKKAGVSKKDLG